MTLLRLALPFRLAALARTPRADRPLRVLAVASVLTVLAVTALVVGVVLWSATRSDEVTNDRQRQIVAYALTSSARKIAYDQESIANWDEAVVKTRHAFDPEWVDINLGVWMHTYFKHDRVLILDGENRPIYAMADGRKTAVGPGVVANWIGALARDLRQKIRNGALDDYERGAARIPRVEDLSILEGRPAVISIMPLLPHSLAVTQERGTEVVVVSVRFLDRTFLKDVADTYLLDGVRIARVGGIRPGEQSYPLRSNAGVLLGYFVWSPKLPGSTILSEVLPVLSAGLLSIGVAVVFLIGRLRHAYTELATSERQAKHLAFHDPLTGLPNRAYFNQHLEQSLAETRDGRGALALMFLDLDRFKQVNDTLGHAAGDALIRDLATHIAAALGPNDMLARMGGDEFAIVLRNFENTNGIEALCREIVHTVSQPFEILGGQATVGVSIGIALASAEDLDRSELARRADIALYQAKRGGGQRFQFFTEDTSLEIQKHRELEVELRQALRSESEIDVVYQPVYSADRLEIAGVEALVRWTNPRLGAVSPPVFVALAEECGLIDKLGDLVLRRACLTASAWDVGTVAVNVSPLQFRQPDFADRVLAVLAEAGMPPSRLEIEITESTLLDASGASERGLNTLRKAGVKVALDDFGTGYSSLSYLMKLDVDRIKIDRSFVRHLGKTAQSESIVQAIVTMAHAVGVAVTAEGVETREQQEFLTRIGCDHLQGYLFSQPLSALRLVDVFAAGPKDPTRTGSAAA